MEAYRLFTSYSLGNSILALMQAHKRGIPASPLASFNRWKELVRYRNPYQTRHGYASMMLMAGEHVMWVATQMGHTDWSFTAKRYSRWIVSDMPDAGSKAVAAWSQLGHSAAVGH